MLTSDDVVFVPPAADLLTKPNPSGDDFGRTGPFLAYVMETYVGLGGAPSSISSGSAFGRIFGHYFDQLTPQDAQAYLVGYVEPAMSRSIGAYAGKPITQLPTTVSVPITPPQPPTGLANPAADAIAVLGAAVQDLVPSLLGGLAPILIGAIVLIAILVLIYTGIKRTIL